MSPLNLMFTILMNNFFIIFLEKKRKASLYLILQYLKSNILFFKRNGLIFLGKNSNSTFGGTKNVVIILFLDKR